MRAQPPTPVEYSTPTSPRATTQAGASRPGRAGTESRHAVLLNHGLQQISAIHKYATNFLTLRGMAVSPVRHFRTRAGTTRLR